MLYWNLHLSTPGLSLSHPMKSPSFRLLFRSRHYNRHNCMPLIFQIASNGFPQVPQLLHLVLMLQRIQYPTQY